MCGICGEIRFDGEPVAEAVLGRMRDQMEPRGPDSSGIFQQGRVGFAHRRLKVIDVSEHAQQPMVDSALGLSIVYNGAIYNYKELREELASKGHHFFSDGDTEVILKAYAEWGDAFVERLSGMFAFAILERDSGGVLLGRDRLGIKPLYFNQAQSCFRFASTLPALLAAGGVDTEIDPVALNYYMSFHAVVPAPHTIVKGVRKLPPATLLRIEPDGTKKQWQYWDCAYGTPASKASYSFEDWQDEVLASLRNAVDKRLVADVPVGVLLSGGLDSSMIVGLLAEAGQHGLATFSVGFESVGDVEGNEFKYSDVVAKRFETNHHKIQVSSERLLSSLPACVASMSEPMVSHDNIGFYLLSQEVKKHVTVVQSGQGADEVFAGYSWYPPLLESTNPLQDYQKFFFDRDFAAYQEAVERKYVDEDFALQFVREHFNAEGAEAGIDKALRIDSRIMLTDDPVKRVDNMTMAWGLEARVPFLDHEVVELAAQIPAKFKVEGDGKYVLKGAARRVVPHKVIDRPKGYFPVPALKYLRGDSLQFVQDILSTDAMNKRGMFNVSYIEKILKDPEEYITPLGGSELWQVALLEYWLQTNKL